MRYKRAPYWGVVGLGLGQGMIKELSLTLCELLENKSVITVDTKVETLKKWKAGGNKELKSDEI